MSSARITAWSRRFLLASAAWFVLSQAAGLAGLPRRVEVTLALYGFVLTTVFGKGYSLLPAYFDRTLAWSGAPAVQWPLTTGGVGAMAVGAAGLGPSWLSAAGRLTWVAGTVVFVGTMLVTFGDNLTGAQTGTGEASAERRGLDRLANAFVPMVLLYVLAGCVELVGGTLGLPTPFGGVAARTSHLLAAGGALLLLFAVGYRLLPRFLGEEPSTRVAAGILTLAGVGPALLAWGYPGGLAFRVGAVAQSTAVIGFAVTYGRLLSRSDRSRVGLYSVAVGLGFGCLGVAVGAHMAFDGFDAGLAAAHWRLNVYGLLGLSIVGAVYQFYPPAICPRFGGSDRGALLTIALVGAGLGLVAGTSVLGIGGRPVGHALALCGATGYTYLLTGTIRLQTAN